MSSAEQTIDRGAVGAAERLPRDGSSDTRTLHGVQLRIHDVRLATADAVQLAHRKSIKRVLDLFVASLLVVLLAPFFLVIATLIRLDSAGPVFFLQSRMGRGGRPFSIIKFRTMRVLENGDTVVQASRNDARVTRVGRVLRRTSIDELPQLFNVLRGDMSLVGPRPHALAHDRYYGALIADYAQRWRVRPGITGWAQINGSRGATPTLESMRARIAFDIWYVRNASLATDLAILLRTPFEIVHQRGAW